MSQAKELRNKDIVQMYKQGFSINQIGIKYGLRKQTVWVIVNRDSKKYGEIKESKPSPAPSPFPQ